MKPIKLAAAFLTATTCLAPLLPAVAGPLDKYSGSYLDPSTLSSNPQLLCSDIVKTNTSEYGRGSAQSDSSREGSSDAWKRTENDARNSSEKSSKGGSFAGFGATMSDEKASSNSSASSDEGKRDRSRADSSSNSDQYYSKTSTATAAGKDCSEILKSSAVRDAAAFQADAQVQSVKIATEGKVEAIKTESNGKFLESLLKW